MERGVVFGGYRFDRPTGRLWSGKREVRLTPKATAVLGMLVTRAGDLVTKEELLGSVWKDTAVSDDALISCVQELRKALADNAKQPRFIETRHRRGYRFIAHVSEATTKQPRVDPRPLSRTPTDRSTDLNADAAGPAKIEARLSEIRGRPRVAVLPFTNASGDTDQEYFTEGITSDIITALSKHRSLLVIARTSTFAFKGRSIDARRAGMGLGADYVVDGSVAKSGQRLRIRARLIEADAGRHVWAERYDRHLEDVFEVQDEITAAIAARIEPEVGSVERLRAERKSPEAFRAWDFFHLGMKHFYKSTVEDNEEAQRLLRRAIELDPTLAQAHAWLSYAIVLSMIYFDADPDDERLSAAVMLAKKGVDLDDQDALTHFAYGRVLLARKAYEGALAELESAAELNPTLAIAYCGLGDSV
jgi:TolB-like protein